MTTNEGSCGAARRGGEGLLNFFPEHVASSGDAYTGKLTPVVLRSVVNCHCLLFYCGLI